MIQVEWISVCLPKIPVFITDDNRKLWTDDSKYVIELNISDLELYPDFGSLVDEGAYYDGKLFYWDDWSEIKNPKILEFIEDHVYDEPIIRPEDFTLTFDEKDAESSVRHMNRHNHYIKKSKFFENFSKIRQFQKIKTINRYREKNYGQETDMFRRKESEHPKGTFGNPSEAYWTSCQGL